MKRTSFACVAIVAVLLAAGARRDVPPSPIESAAPVILDTNYDTCTEGACNRVCRAWVNNPWCFGWVSYCRAADNACVCMPVCLAKGEKPHIEMQPTSCEDVVDACWP